MSETVTGKPVPLDNASLPHVPRTFYAPTDSSAQRHTFDVQSASPFYHNLPQGRERAAQPTAEAGGIRRPRGDLMRGANVRRPRFFPSPSGSVWRRMVPRGRPPAGRLLGRAVSPDPGNRLPPPPTPDPGAFEAKSSCVTVVSSTGQTSGANAPPPGWTGPANGSIGRCPRHPGGDDARMRHRRALYRRAAARRLRWTSLSAGDSRRLRRAASSWGRTTTPSSRRAATPSSPTRRPNPRWPWSATTRA